MGEDRPEGHHFAGTPFHRPKTGDKVVVIAGEDLAREFTVTRVEGNAYRSDNRIYVDHPRVEPTWYYSWDLRVIPS